MIIVVVYIIGVVIGLSVMRDPWPVRVGTAMVWPLGPVAFLVVIATLLVAALILWPLLMVPAAVLVGALLWWMT